MCTTPLQILIAEKIIQLNVDERFDLLLVINDTTNSKFEKYFDRLKINCDKSMVYELKNQSRTKKIQKFLIFKKIYKQWSYANYSSYYLASIDNAFFHWILSHKSKTSDFFTFDDGIANIFINSSYFNEKKVFLHEFIWKILGVNFNTKKVKTQSKIHYTIYPNRKNIVDNKRNIELFSNLDFCSNSEGKKEEINLFLGQPLYEVNIDYDEDYILNILNKFKIDLYFPHPREKYNFDNKILILKSDCIFEDYIVKLLIEYKNVNIYTFFSTAALNVEGVSNVKVYYLMNNFLKENYSSLYDLFNSGSKSNLINVE